MSKLLRCITVSGLLTLMTLHSYAKDATANKKACVKAFQDLSEEYEKAGNPAIKAKAKLYRLKSIDSTGDKFSIENERGEAEIFTAKGKYKIKERPSESCESDESEGENSNNKLAKLYDKAIVTEADDTESVKEKKKLLQSECPPHITRKQAKTRLKNGPDSRNEEAESVSSQEQSGVN